MPWSTRELADLAGTTVNTVRHYHRIGVLDEPRRAPNGYKQYDSSHLRQLLHVRRLRDLGVPTAQIPQHVRGEQALAASGALAAIQADLSAAIERLQRVRAELTVLLSGEPGPDVGDTPADRST